MVYSFRHAGQQWSIIYVMVVSSGVYFLLRWSAVVYSFCYCGQQWSIVSVTVGSSDI